MLQHIARDSKPHIKVVLVIWPVEARSNERPRNLLLSRRDRSRCYNARQFDLELNRAILIQIPVKTIFVVAHRRNRGYHESTRSAHLDPPRSILVILKMLPKKTIVLLVHANGIRQNYRLALGIVDRRIEIMDLTQAVAA